MKYQNIVFAIYIILSFFCSCKEGDNKLFLKKVINKKEVKVKIRHAIKKDIRIEYYLNKKIKSKHKYINNKLEGTSYNYNTDGNISSIINYKNGLKHGNFFLFTAGGDTALLLKYNMGRKEILFKYTGFWVVTSLYKKTGEPDTTIYVFKNSYEYDSIRAIYFTK